MASRRGSASQSEPKERRSATTPEAREHQLVALAVDLAEKQLRDGTASAQVISHYIRAGSMREQLERQRILHENELLKIKAEQIANQGKHEELVRNALEAMRSYTGNSRSEELDEYDD